MNVSDFNPAELPIVERDTCRVCKSEDLTWLYSIGNQYVNDFIGADGLERVPRAPLEMILCNKCTLPQLKHTAPQELLYAGNYWYTSGITQTMRDALRDITKNVEDNFDLKAGDVVLDIGSNDGTMLRSYQIPGIVTVGCEPAKTFSPGSQYDGSKGLDHFINDFWTLENYHKVLDKKAKVVTAIGMFYDMEDPNQFIKDAADVMTDDGVFIAQLMCLKNMLETNDVGNICHEHLEYYSLQSLDYLFNNNGLEIFDIEENNVNGGSYRLFCRKTGSSVEAPEGSLERLLQAYTAEINFDKPEVHLDFFQRLEDNKKQCVDFIKQEVENGKRVWVYGASTKGNVILQYYGLDHTLIEAASERTERKWGKYTVGSMIPIVSEEEARKAQPDYFLVLPYAFFDEMYEREKEWRDKGGKFIVPLPKFRVVE
jgi:NDP-4-keto-2,6-dideoxyhexose 3-C-methyltransferase